MWRLHIVREIGGMWITEESIMSVKISKQAHNLSASKWIKRRNEEFGWCPATLLSYFPKSGSINIEETRFDSEN